MRISRRTRGIIISVLGALLGGVVAFLLVVLLVAGPSSDGPNGWWDDPDGWLVLLIPPITLAGIAVGTHTALRIRGFEQRGRTVGLVVLFTLFALLLLSFGWMGPFRLLVGYPGTWLGFDLPLTALTTLDQVVLLLGAVALARGIADRKKPEPATVQGS